MVFSRRISRPLKDIAAAASEIAAGNLQLQLPEDGTVESVAVARAFNGMSASLQVAHGKLVHDATHDPLTRLPNRALFMERLERAMIRRRRHPHYCFAVLFIDLDRFKHVNDSLGHSAGDELLILFAERLAHAVRRDDAVARLTAADDEHDASTLARFGGDEFVVLLDDIRDPIDAVRISERIQQVSAEAFGVAGEDVFATPSIGVAVASSAHGSAADLLRDADLAMYRAKQSGGGTFAVADAAMHEQAVNRLHLETELRRAIDRGEFRVRYQPIVSLGDRRVVGFEALVRWQHPERGLLSPVDFLAVADEVGLTPQIDEWVLREACRQGKEWSDAHTDAKPPMLSVNLSPKCFAQATLVQQIADTLSTSGFSPARLRLEITESTAIRDPERAKVVLAELRRMGVRVSIDDFGTGYSSLSYLQMFPVDVLKIDRSFVERLAPNTSESEIIQLILGLAKTLGLDVVAEGAETEAQVRYLEALGCGYGQGFFFDRPLEAADAWRRAGSVTTHT
jgi:diguanylate cyclase (GGDEF)-like protein